MNKLFPFQTLYARLAAGLLFIFLLVAVFSAMLFMRSSRAYQQEITQRMHRELAPFVVEHYSLFNAGQPDLNAVKKTFHDLMIMGPNFEFYLLDKNGTILAYSADPAKIKRETIDITSIQEFQAAKIDAVIYGDDPRSLSRKKVFSAAPVFQDDELVGFLYVILGSEIYDDIANMVSQSKIIQWGLWLLVAGLGFGLLSMLWVAGIITRPLARLTAQVRKVQETGFENKQTENSESLLAELKHWQSGSNNEIHTLGTAFSQLLDKLNQQYTNVLTIDQLRKELLSHVSHDLRTPLASLLGYLETWEINRESLSDEQSIEYIAIARKSAERVSNLVEQLFELAHLDSGTVQVNLEPFSLPELVQDVIQKFSITAEEKQLSLSVEPQDTTIRVVADIEKLERVFSNLIENAIRHTRAGGRITIRISPESRMVAVEVSDNGIGIPPEDVPHVFDAHYKAGNSVRGNSAHGGLGLAITKKLLDLHKSPIQVQSQVDRGTTFHFQLEAAI